MSADGRRETLARLLRRGGHYTVDRLVGELGVSRRTVLRDLVVLRARGYRIDGEGGPGGGLRMDPDTVMLSGQLRAEEVVGLIISMALLRASPWMPFSTFAERAVAKIEKSLPGSRVRELRRLLQRVLVAAPAHDDAGRPPGPIDVGLLARFERAFTGHLCLELDYTDRLGKPSRRRVEPQALLVRAPFWYVVGWDANRDGLRLFRMDRIRHPRVLEGDGFELRALSLVKGICPDAEQARPRRTG